MRAELNIDLPPELKDFKNNIEATIKPYIRITTKVAKNLNLRQSKFGGVPYLPKNVQYPKGSKDQELFLLAQINFEEVPDIEPYPEKGILQFYIGDDDLYGLNFDNMMQQKNFRILYFPEVAPQDSSLVTNFDFLPRFDYMPISEGCSLKFEQKYEPISTLDYNFESKIFGEDFSESKDIRYKIYDQYQNIFQQGEGHKIGGYPYFTQYDPRARDEYRNEQFNLLFQMDSDWKANIMWGDSGVGNFFIRENDLRIRDFSQVMYNWDCA